MSNDKDKPASKQHLLAKILENMRDSDPEYDRLANENFWDLTKNDSPKETAQPTNPGTVDELDDTHLTARDVNTNDLIVVNGLENYKRLGKFLLSVCQSVAELQGMDTCKKVMASYGVKYYPASEKE